MALTFNADVNPVKITGDTAAAVSIFSGKVFVRHIYWFDPAAAAHLCTITDGDGNPILELRAEADDISQFYTLDMHFDGISISDMDSGTLFIYIR